MKNGGELNDIASPEDDGGCDVSQILEDGSDEKTDLIWMDTGRFFEYQ